MTANELAGAMQRHELLEDPAPPAAERWIATFLDAFGTRSATIDDALREVALLRAEATMIPALELERLRNRQVVFFLDAVSQYVDAQAELRDLPLASDIPAIAGYSSRCQRASTSMRCCSSLTEWHSQGSPQV